MPAGKKAETKDTKKKSKSTQGGVVSTESSILTRLAVVEKMLVITRDEFTEMKGMLKRIKDRMGL
tara:strand:- start:6604 stop:6798 length:195 start_codon:yes stop_codon:yes gene_type:complete